MVVLAEEAEAFSRDDVFTHDVYGIKLRVRSPSDASRRYEAKIKFLDADGFLLYETDLVPGKTNKRRGHYPVFGEEGFWVGSGNYRTVVGNIGLFPEESRRVREAKVTLYW